MEKDTVSQYNKLNFIEKSGVTEQNHLVKYQSFYLYVMTENTWDMNIFIKLKRKT